MNFISIAIALLLQARRLGAAGLFFLGSVALAGSNSAIPGRSLTINGIRTNYALSRGVTSFVIRLPSLDKDRTFTFFNENTAAEGQLLIAVSNQPLVADSPLWNAVGGAIRFRHKRLFMLSLVGVEAKYVRLTFQVEAPNGNTTADFPAGYRCVEGREPLNAYASSREIIIADRPRSQRLDHGPFPDSLYKLARTASS